MNFRDAWNISKLKKDIRKLKHLELILWIIYTSVGNNRLFPSYMFGKAWDCNLIKIKISKQPKWPNSIIFLYAIIHFKINTFLWLMLQFLKATALKYFMGNFILWYTYSVYIQQQKNMCMLYIIYYLENGRKDCR